MAEDKNAPLSTPLGKPGGLYDSVRLTRKSADRLAIASLALLVVLVVLIVMFGRSGMQVSFDPNGGTDVESIRAEYGQPLPEPEQPRREGYIFTGWYLDPACSEVWSADDTVTGNMTLYAGWEKEP